MKQLVIASSLVAVGLLQVPGQGQDQDLHQPVPLTAIECEIVDEVLPGELDPDLWAARLSEGDLDLRMAAYEAIVEAGVRDRRVFECVQRWAGDPLRGELAWTARMALREIGRIPEVRDDAWGFDPGALDWFHDSTFGRMGLSPQDFERSLAEKFEALQRRMEQGFAPGAAPGRGVEQRSFQVEFGPNGMKVRTRQLGADGESERQWEARSIEELLQAHPELEREFPGLRGLRLRFGVPGTQASPIAPAADAGPRTDVLGVECRMMVSGEAEGLGLPEGVVGLLVVRTVPGTIADELGVRRGDVLTRLNAAPLTSPVHITMSLARREPLAQIKLRLYDAKGQQRTVVWSPREPGSL